jgi:tetratricopeptide (TPR) repeat protein
MPLVCDADSGTTKALLGRAAALSDSRPEQAIMYFKKAYELGIALDNDDVCAEALEGFAWCMHIEGDDELALNLCNNALYYCPKYNTGMLAKIKSATGVIYSRLGNHAAAEKNLLESLRLFRSRGDSIHVYKVYLNLGMLYETNKNIDKSLFYNMKALDMVRKYNDLSNECKVLNNLGTIGDDYPKRMSYLQQALKLCFSNNDLSTVSACYANMADCFYNQEKYAAALNMLDKSDEYASVVNAKYVLLNNLQVRSQIYKMQKDYALSLSCMERYVEESKALNDAKRLKDIKNEVTSRQLLKLRAENELEKKKNEIIKERIYWTLSGSFLIILILIGLFRYYIFRKQKEAELVKARNKVMELEMEQKEAIITDVNSELQRAKERLRYLRLFLQTRNELLENIRDQIRKSYKIQGAEHITFLKQINTYISQYQIKQDAKNALSDDEKQNEEFMKRLKEKYPAITQVELRLATYLRADLSNKEIALLIGAQIKTIETNRYRLRKVLQLDADTDICQYLNRKFLRKFH